VKLVSGTLVRLRPDHDPFDLGLGIVLGYEPEVYNMRDYCWVQFFSYLDTRKWCHTKNLLIISEPK
jgi:hypothetical protein